MARSRRPRPGPDVGISSPGMPGSAPDAVSQGMPLSADSYLALTAAADTLIQRGRGRLAADDALAARRIAEFLGDRDCATLKVLINECGIAPMDIAALVRQGALVVLEGGSRDRLCERCNRPASPGTGMCDPCRSYLGWSRLRGEEVGAAPLVVSLPQPTAVPVAGGTGMRSRVRRRR